ncbi:hypothetical protein lerEdw1_006181 [Lerista edwardsae]|nr:hypothetical protein lerEdw1_006181 [Lerista edwardsae]
MRPGGGISWSFVSEQRIRQLERKLRAKEERIIVLETENALLHLKLAEWQGTMGKILVDESHNSIVPYKQQNLNENIRFILIQLHGVIQMLKQEMNSLRVSALAFSRDVYHQGESYLYQILAAVQRLQLHNNIMQTFQMKALELEQSLHEVNEKYQQEKQKRKVLHNSLIELRGNIRVHCRVRPLLPFDASGELVSEDRHRNFSENVVYAVDDVSILNYFCTLN